jgi:hypothetical protein
LVDNMKLYIPPGFRHRVEYRGRVTDYGRSKCIAWCYSLTNTKGAKDVQYR